MVVPAFAGGLAGEGGAATTGVVAQQTTSRPATAGIDADGASEDHRRKRLVTARASRVKMALPSS